MPLKYFFFVIGVLFISTIIGSILFALGYRNDFSFILAEGGNSIGLLLGFWMLVLNGSLLKTKYLLLIIMGFGLSLIGGLIKVLHWNYANILVILGTCIVLFSYLVSFINKREKRHLDILKLIWVIAYLGNIISHLFHISSNDYAIISITILWLAIIDFIVLEVKKEEVLEQ